MPNKAGTSAPKLMNRLDNASQPKRPRNTKPSQALRLLRSGGIGRVWAEPMGSDIFEVDLGDLCVGAVHEPDGLTLCECDAALSLDAERVIGSEPQCECVHT